VYAEQASGIIARHADLAATFGVEVMVVLVALGGEPLALQILEATGADPRLRATLEDFTPGPVRVTGCTPNAPRVPSICRKAEASVPPFSPSSPAIAPPSAPMTSLQKWSAKAMIVAIVAECNLRRRFYQ